MASHGSQFECGERALRDSLDIRAGAQQLTQHVAVAELCCPHGSGLAPRGCCLDIGAGAKQDLHRCGAAAGAGASRLTRGVIFPPINREKTREVM